MIFLLHRSFYVVFILQYAFVDSQSLQPDTQPATKLWADDHSIQSVATATGTGHLLTPVSRKKSNLTPISSSRAKTKRCSSKLLTVALAMMADCASVQLCDTFLRRRDNSKRKMNC